MKALTVRELVGFLKTVNQNALVGLSSDSEGNSFSLVVDDSFCVDKAYLIHTYTMAKANCLKFVHMRK